MHTLWQKALAKADRVIYSKAERRFLQAAKAREDDGIKSPRVTIFCHN